MSYFEQPDTQTHWRSIMKKLVSLALTLIAATVLPASAMALDTTSAFEVRIQKAGGRECDAGTWYFELDADDGYSCIYDLEWASPTGWISTECIVREAKVHGARSCIRNAFCNFPTVVELATDCDCMGFSDLGLLEDVLLLSLGESFVRLDGVILLTGPTGTVHGVDAVMI
jgi:hypothetical protein